MKTANSSGEVESVYPFIWRVARNVYADAELIAAKIAELIKNTVPDY